LGQNYGRRSNDISCWKGEKVSGAGRERADTNSHQGGGRKREVFRVLKKAKNQEYGKGINTRRRAVGKEI